MDDLSDLIKAAVESDPNMKIMQENEVPGMEGMMKMDEVTTETKTEGGEKKPEAPKAENITPEANAEGGGTKKPEDSSLKNGTEQKGQPEVAQTKSFDDLLLEKSEGKFKTWDEITEKLSKPEVKFADERVAKINEYIEQGGSYEDWVSTQNINFDDLTPAEQIAYEMQLKDPDLTSEEIELELKLKYGWDKWKENVEDYEEGVEPDDVKISKLRFEREAKKAKQTLLDYQKKWSVPQNKLAAEQLKAQDDAKAQSQEKWEKAVDESVKSIEKLPLKLSDADKDVIDYALSADEQKEINKVVKQLYHDSRSLFVEFIDKKSPVGLNVKGITEMIAKAKFFDKAIQIAATQARAAGQESIVKNIKNVDMNPSGNSSTTSQMKSIQQQMAEQILKNDS